MMYLYPMKEQLTVILFVTMGALPWIPAHGFESIYERAPILYYEREPDNRVTRLLAQAQKEGFLSIGTDREILLELLARLEIPLESQLLVFSKTSAQNSRIAPNTPRAIYFSDDVYIGWVQGGEIEVASLDERLGMVFHLIRLSDREDHRPPELVRERSCLNCHAGSSNQDLPGLMVRSVFPSDSGLPLFEAGTFHTRQSSPIHERWGGWYVTGEVESESHLGNAIATVVNQGVGGVALQPFASGRVDTLDALFNAAPYPYGGQSDVVALMVLEHQTGVHNVLVEANLTTQATLYRHNEMKKAFGEPVEAPLSETNERILDRMADKVLHEMLYVDEVEVPGGIEGGVAFQNAFHANAKKSTDGRSLKDFRLYGRLMKYRCSHLIYSEAFENLPWEMHTRVLDKLHSILTRSTPWPDYSHLADSEREHLLTILSETVPNLPPSWE
jgi:hypothetical protein